MTGSINLLPGSHINWRGKQLAIVDYDGLDKLIARPLNGSALIQVPVSEISSANEPGNPVPQRDLIGIPESEWAEASRLLEAIRPLLETGPGRRSREDVKRVSESLGKHPATIYRWLKVYRESGRASTLLRKQRSDKGEARIDNSLEKIIDEAIKTKYLTLERPKPTAAIEEVEEQCKKLGIEPPHENTIRRRIARLAPRSTTEKRYGKKAASERFDPIQGSFPGADVPLAVVQIDHTPMDVIVVDEADRQPIGRPTLTIALDVFSRMVIGFTIYLEPPSAFSTGQTISHAVLPKDDWLAEIKVRGTWPCWGKMRKIHCDNAKEFRGTVIGRACNEFNITVEHRPKGRPQYGGHIERGFRTFMARVHRLKGTTFSDVHNKGDYDSEGRACMTRAELEQWFTVYIVKFYSHKYHRGIKTTPYAKYQEGILGSDTQIGIGLPEMIADPQRFMLDFLPFEERTVQEYGLLINHFHYYDDALRPWIHAPSENNPKEKRKFLVRYNPRDLSEVYFLDPVSNDYITIPLRDRSRTATSKWEVRAAEARLRLKGYKQVNEALIYEAICEMRDIEEESARKTKATRRAQEKRNFPPKSPVSPPKKPPSQPSAPEAVADDPADDLADVQTDVAPFEDIVEPD